MMIINVALTSKLFGKWNDLNSMRCLFFPDLIAFPHSPCSVQEYVFFFKYNYFRFFKAMCLFEDLRLKRLKSVWRESEGTC